MHIGEKFWTVASDEDNLLQGTFTLALLIYMYHMTNQSLGHTKLIPVCCPLIPCTCMRADGNSKYSIS